jgi:preprotein translocase subunit SecG
MNTKPKRSVASGLNWDFFSSLMPLALVMFALALVLAVFSSRCLYADGADQFINILQHPNCGNLSMPRCFADGLIRLPLLAAIHLGVTDCHWLRLAFGLGCFLTWPLALVLCHRLSPRHFWIVLLACAAGYLNASFMAVGEHIVAHAFFWPAAFALLLVRPLTPFAAAVLLASSVILLRSYESLVFLGPPLAALAGWRLWRGGEKLFARVTLVLAGIFFLTAALLTLQVLVKPEVSREMGGFQNGAIATLLHPSWTLQWSGVWLLLLLAATVSRPFRRLMVRPVAVGLLGLAVVWWGFWPLLAWHSFNPSSQFNARFLNTLVPLGLLVVVLAEVFKPKWLRRQKPFLVSLTAAFLLAQSLWQISVTWQWQGYVSIMKSVLATRSGYVSVSDTPLEIGSVPGQSLQFTWYWVNPCLSIAFCPDGHVRTMLASAPDGYAAIYQTFDPLDPKTFPHLERYGIDYTNYIRALTSPPAK